jgi:hypothetical protein
MRDQEVIEFIRALETSVPKDGAEARFISSGEVTLYANKEGYLRMALELMKCAFKETNSEADLNYIFDKESEFGIDNLAFDKEQLDFFTK